MDFSNTGKGSGGGGKGGRGAAGEEMIAWVWVLSFNKGRVGDAQFYPAGVGWEGKIEPLSGLKLPRSLKTPNVNL